jgi:hypothetical protein
MSTLELTEAQAERLKLARPGKEVLLDRLPDGRFNLRGPVAVVCDECLEVFVEIGGHAGTVKQRHMSIEHSINAGMLP